MSLPGHDLDGIASVPEPIRYDWFTHNSTAAPDGTYYAGESQHNMVVVGILVGLIVVLCLILGFVAIPPIFGYIQSRMPVSPKRIERRYATIDGWLITKVRQRNVKNHGK